MLSYRFPEEHIRKCYIIHGCLSYYELIVVIGYGNVIEQEEGFAYFGIGSCFQIFHYFASHLIKDFEPFSIHLNHDGYVLVLFAIGCSHKIATTITMEHLMHLRILAILIVVVVFF